MSLPKIALFASVAAFLAGGTLYAQAQTVAEGYMLHVDPTTGKTVTMKVDTKGHELIMKEGRLLPVGAIIYRSGGQLRFLEDKNAKRRDAVGGVAAVARSTMIELAALARYRRVPCWNCVTRSPG